VKSVKVSSAALASQKICRRLISKKVPLKTIPKKPAAMYPKKYAADIVKSLPV